MQPEILRPAVQQHAAVLPHEGWVEWADDSYRIAVRQVLFQAPIKVAKLSAGQINVQQYRSLRNASSAAGGDKDLPRKEVLRGLHD